MMLPLLSLLLLLVLLLALYIIYKPPFLLIRYFQHRWPDVLWHVPTTNNKKLVALTIDDIPSAHTREILSILQANDATATFFVIGSQVTEDESESESNHKATLSDLVRAKNELGNHAMYDEPSRGLSDDVLRDQIREVDGMIREAYATATPSPHLFSSSTSSFNAEDIDRPATTTRTTSNTKSHHNREEEEETANPEPAGYNHNHQHLYFRPGSGFFSSRMRELVKELDYKLVLGSVYPHDPQIPYWTINASHILCTVRAGSIIICHDRRSWTAPMLRRVLPELKRRGYRVVTVTELVKEASG